MTRMGNQAPFWLDPRDKTGFPAVELAMTDPNGLLAVGGDLSTQRLLAAYRSGIFPWYSDGQPIIWWSPDPRAVLYPDKLKISRSLRKTIRKNAYTLQLDHDFEGVIAACATARGSQTGTWITTEMALAYYALQQQGYAHSIEVWRDDLLVGGLYGVAIGKVFFGESMFSRERDTSKMALAALVKHLARYDFAFIDCQVESPHLTSLGASAVPRSSFIRQLHSACNECPDEDVWQRFISREELLAML